MNNAFFCFVSAVIIVLLVIDIIGRFNSTYWFRKGFTTGVESLTSVVKSLSDGVKSVKK